MFKTHEFKKTYITGKNNLLTEFYIPALSNAKVYKRISAYFNASSLQMASQGVTALLQRDGYLQFVLGNQLDDAEYEAIKTGYALREKIGGDLASCLASFDDVESNLFNKRMDALQQLIVARRLEIKIAYRKPGIVHNKIGLLYDEAGDAICFSGSANETDAAWLRNSEDISVFESWAEHSAEYFEFYEQQFDDFWHNRAAGNHVVNFEQADYEKLIHRIDRLSKNKFFLSETELSEIEAASSYGSKKKNGPHVPDKIFDNEFELRPHQKAALESWKGNEFKGVMALATGAGKTITAIYGAVRLFEGLKEHGLFTIVSVPYQNLAEQWIDELSLFGIEAIPCYQAKSNWESPLEASIRSFKRGRINFVCCVVVNRTLVSSNFQQLIAELTPENNLLFIGDECHHHGSLKINKSLPEAARFRLGLSATPEHYLDDEKNKNLFSYYGNVIAEYSLSQAIKDKVLTPYYYHVIPVPLTENEVSQYVSLSAQIAQQISLKKKNKGGTRLSSLLGERARLIGNAENKPTALADLLSTIEPEPFTLFYVGEGRGDDGTEDELLDEDSPRQIEAVTTLAAHCGYRPSRFTSRENKSERQRILRDFKDKSIGSLVAMKCLDEGIDIPACKTAFILASSGNPRQFIQRRGRILRRSKEKEFAIIFDFVVYCEPSADSEGSFTRSEENLIVNELSRVAEFANLSENFFDVYKVLRPILEIYGLEGYL